MDVAKTKVILKSALDVLASIAVIVVAVAVVWNFVKPRIAEQERSEGVFALPKDPVPIGDAPTKGSAQAEYAMFIFSDFQCPSCKAFALDTLPTIEREFVDTGKLLLVYRNLPLERIHKFALSTAVAAKCAGEQGRFWQMHDHWFVAPRNEFTEDGVMAAARALGLDAARFGVCVSGPGINWVKTDTLAVKRLGVSVTPTFLIGKIQPERSVRVLRSAAGAKKIDEFSDMLDQLMR